MRVWDSKSIALMSYLNTFTESIAWVLPHVEDKTIAYPSETQGLLGIYEK